MFGKFGVLNPFFGKTHSEESKAKSRKKMKGRKLSPAHKEKVIVSGKNNILRGDVYEFWLNKYGEGEAQKRLENLKRKHSINNSGSGNPMFGKPSPTGSGNGWSGWYNGWYFRSLRELKFVLDLEKNNKIWFTGENKHYKITYVDPFGKQRNYFPDFIVENQIYEIKPKRLWSTPTILAKKKAAVVFAENLNMTYELVDPGKMCEKELDTLYECGRIKWLPRYEEKYLERKKREECAL
jgi:hypothetical protein